MGLTVFFSEKVEHEKIYLGNTRLESVEQGSRERWETSRLISRRYINIDMLCRHMELFLGSYGV